MDIHEMLPSLIANLPEGTMVILRFDEEKEEEEYNPYEDFQTAADIMITGGISGGGGGGDGYPNPLGHSRI
jgi:hypothetical protein